jgi:hypothetical protein
MSHSGAQKSFFSKKILPKKQKEMIETRVGN